MPEPPDQFEETTEDTEAQTRAIRELNDYLRTTFSGGRIMMTPGLQSLTMDQQTAAIDSIRAFDDFTEDNDLYGTHDFDSFDIDDHKLMWKIDCYDKSLEYGSPDPTDPDVTTRVLTIFLLTTNPMGLDQYAYSRDREQNPEFIWRKHAKLQSFMEHLYYARVGADAELFNCVELELGEGNVQGCMGTTHGTGRDHAARP